MENHNTLMEQVPNKLMLFFSLLFVEVKCNYFVTQLGNKWK